MILLDLNQIVLSNLLRSLSFNPDIEENLIRHMILNSIRMYNVKYKDQYGDMIICCDDGNYWRKAMFPYYKAARKKGREESDLDWKSIFTVMNETRDDLKEYFPYRVLHVETAEADDAIGTMCMDYGDQEPIMIVSSDGDFAQLQRHMFVNQYSPIQKKPVRCTDPEGYLKEHIIRGDSGDGVPNFLSDDDTFVTDKKQKKIMKVKLEQWLKMEPEEFCDEKMLRGYRRNEALVDLRKIPMNIQEQFRDQYINGRHGDRSKMFNYFVTKRLKNLMNSLQEF